MLIFQSHCTNFPSVLHFFMFLPTVCIYFKRQEASWKYSGKRRKCCLPTFSPFYTMFCTSSQLKFVKWIILNPVPYDKILDQTKLKAFANNKSNVKKMIISVFDRVENIVVKIPSKGVIVWEWIKLSSVNALNHYETTNFRPFQTERVCSRQFQIGRKWQKVIQMGRKLCGKKGEISPFSHSVFKRLVSQQRQKVSLCGNGLTLLTKWQDFRLVQNESICRHIKCC